MVPAECNYEIYDKEILMIIYTLKEWDTKLRGVPYFLILIDHKNLEYFITTWKLNK